MGRNWVIVLLIVATSSWAWAKEPSTVLEELPLRLTWNQTSLNPEMLTDQLLTVETCFYNQRSFVGCFFAISRMIQLEHGSNAILDLSLSSPLRGEVTKEVGPFRVFIIPEFSQSPKNLQRSLKKDIENRVEQYYQNSIEPIVQPLRDDLNGMVTQKLELENIFSQFNRDVIQQPDLSDEQVEILWEQKYSTVYEQGSTQLDHLKEAIEEKNQSLLDKLDLHDFFLSRSESFESVDKSYQAALCAHYYNIYLQYVSDGHAIIMPGFSTQNEPSPEEPTPFPVSHKIIGVGTDSYDLIKINVFQTTESFKKGADGHLQTPICHKVRDLIEARDSVTRGYILDLRNNLGGLISEATCILDLFLAKDKPLLSTGINSPTNLESYEVSRNPALTQKPLAVLINSHSASASEIVAGALQDHKRAILLGERSFGKGSYQQTQIGTHPVLRQWNSFWYGFSDLVYVETAGLYFLPSGRSPQWVGIQPDIPIFDPSAKGNHPQREEELFPRGLRPPTANIQQTDDPHIQKIRICAQLQETLHKYERKESGILWPDLPIMGRAMQSIDCLLMEKNQR
ncbi:MAG: hypothetical protein KDD33_07245 [Bdellovibrionales bacterium]|nr:hypothetical protein [Bdellovibrionales bacterium]